MNLYTAGASLTAVIWDYSDSQWGSQYYFYSANVRPSYGDDDTLRCLIQLYFYENFNGYDVKQYHSMVKYGPTNIGFLTATFVSWSNVPFYYSGWYAIYGSYSMRDTSFNWFPDGFAFNGYLPFIYSGYGKILKYEYAYTPPKYYYNTAIKTPAYYAYTAPIYQYIPTIQYTKLQYKYSELD